MARQRRRVSRTVSRTRQCRPALTGMRRPYLPVPTVNPLQMGSYEPKVGSSNLSGRALERAWNRKVLGLSASRCRCSSFVGQRSRATIAAPGTRRNRSTTGRPLTAGERLHAKGLATLRCPHARCVVLPLHDACCAPVTRPTGRIQPRSGRPDSSCRPRRALERPFAAQESPAAAHRLPLSPRGRNPLGCRLRVPPLIGRRRRLRTFYVEKECEPQKT